MTQSQVCALKLYQSVIEDVIVGVRDSFLDEGVDDQILQELKQIWETKLLNSKAVELTPEPPEPQPPVLSKDRATTSKVNQVNHFGQQQNSQTQLGSQSSQTTAALGAIDLNKPVPLQLTLPPQQGSTDSQPRVLTIHVPASAIQNNSLQSLLSGPIITATMALPQQLASSLLQQHINAALQGQAASGANHSLAQQQTTTQESRPQQMNQFQPIRQLDGSCDSEANDMSSCSNSRYVSQSSAIRKSQNYPSSSSQTENDILVRKRLDTRLLKQLDGNHDTSDDDDDDDDDDDEDDVDDDDDDDNDRDDDENEEEAEGGAEEEPLNSGDDVSDEDPSDLFDTDNVVVCQYDKITRTRNKWKFYLKDGIMNLAGKDYVFQKANGDAEW